MPFSLTLALSSSSKGETQVYMDDGQMFCRDLRLDVGGFRAGWCLNKYWTWQMCINMGLIHWSLILFCVVLTCDMEKAMAPHSITLAWKIPWTEEPGRLQSMGSLRIGHA